MRAGKSVLSWLTAALMVGCSFTTSIDPNFYFPCRPDGSCPKGCRCLAGQACVPDEKEKPPEFCEWCPPGKTNCDAYAGNGCEADLAQDPRNCGYCGNQCQSNEFCQFGVCLGSCPEPYLQCGWLCINPKANHEHCGGCNRACPSEQVCAEGECVEECPLDERACAGACVHVESDPANCGACGRLCLIEHGIGYCENSQCKVRDCFSPFANCDGNVSNGCETDISSNNLHCNGCGRPCPPHEECRAWQCSCENGWADCDGDHDNGCEIDTTSNLHNCGLCFNECPSPHLACDQAGDIEKVSYRCIESECREHRSLYAPCVSNCSTAGQCSCSEGYCVGEAVCGQQVCRPGEFCADQEERTCGCGTFAEWKPCLAEERCCLGVCTPVNNANCQGCGMACPPNNTCINDGVGDGLCVCERGYGECDQNIENGCEALNDDPYCGRCGNNCPHNEFCTLDLPNDMLVCQECPAGTMDCNDSGKDGCEKNVFVDPLNCGYCGNVCGIGVCCEGFCTDISQDRENCGQCGNDCVPEKICLAGRCGMGGVLCASSNGNSIITCPAEYACCLDINGTATCANTGSNSCVDRDWQIQCDDQVDCIQDFKICCLFSSGQPTRQVTKCVEACEFQRTICGSEADCPEGYSCCKETLSVGTVTLGLWLCRPGEGC